MKIKIPARKQIVCVNLWPQLNIKCPSTGETDILKKFSKKKKAAWIYMGPEH